MRNGSKESIVNKDQIKGQAKVIVGNVEEQAGYVTGNTKVEGKGILLQAEGKVQNAWGGVKDAVGKASDKIGAKSAEAVANVKKKVR